MTSKIKKERERKIENSKKRDLLEEKKDKIRLHNLTTKKFIKTRKKYVRKKVKYVVVTADKGSYVEIRNKTYSQFFIHEKIERGLHAFLRMLSEETIPFEDRVWSCIQHYITNPYVRNNLDFIFYLKDGEKIPILKNVLTGNDKSKNKKESYYE